MDFLKKRLSMTADPDKDKEEKTPGSNLFNSFSERRATLWNDFTSKIKSASSSPDGSEADDDESENKANKQTNGMAFMDTVRQKLQSVRQKYDEIGENDTEDSKLRGEPECAPLIDTADNSSVGGDSDQATFGESEATESAPQITINGSDEASANVRRKKLSKRQDSFTAEEVYLDTVAAQVRCGLVQPDTDTVLVSPSKAVEEFVFAGAGNKTKPKTQSKSKHKSKNNTLSVTNGNLINFDSIQNLSQAASTVAETIVHHEDDGVLDYESSGDESSEPVYTEFASRRDSLNSISSIESNYEDDESKELKEFAIKFVNNIFSDNSNSNEDKAKFGQCVQDGSFRLEFSRAISEKRANRKAVTEHTFYQLVQYFAVVLFECDEADDFSPAMILMNMCFTFYYEACRAGKLENNYLSTYLKNQPIWQSMRYWNAAFYEAVQNERVRKPLTTNKDNSDDEVQDRTFQENIIFGQLGTFLHNMRAFGLNIEWCLEFLRKQSTIGNLDEEQIQMLRDSLEAVETE